MHKFTEALQGNSFKGREKLLTCLNSKGMSKGVIELQGTAYSLNLALLELNYIFGGLFWVKCILIYPGVTLD